MKKYQAMEMTACKDGRARGMFQFYGANRTGRFAGRHIQLQNLPQNHLPDLSEARELVRQGNYEALDMLYESIPDVLSQLIRTAFVPRKGMKFVVSDFSAIEARVISWLAGERWKSEAFAAGKDIYCSTASQMFGVPVVKHGINGNLRQKGKIAELACGYGGSVGALKAMGALDMGIPEEELGNLVQSWRSANPHIVDSGGRWMGRSKRPLSRGPRLGEQHSLLLPERYAFHRSAQQPAAFLCKAPDRREPLRRGIRHL